MYATNYFEDFMLNLMRGQNINDNNEWPKVYLAMFVSNPGDTGQEGTEVSYSGYQRQEIAFSDPASDATGLSMSNVSQINFAECPVNLGSPVTHVGVMTTQQGGNMLLYGELDTPLNLQNGITPIFRIGSVKWIWSGNLGDYYRRAIMNTLRGYSCTGFSPYIALCNGDPQQIQGAEFSGLNYARIPLTVTVPAQQTNGTDLCYNANEIISNESTGNWGTLTHIAVYDAASSGHEYAVIPIGNAFEITTHTAVGFHIGSLRFSVN